MNDHVDGNTLRDKMQSAYRSGHSTETELANQERYRCGTRPKEHGYTCDARFVKRIRHDRARSLAYLAWAHIRHHGQSIGVAAILLERTTPECSCRYSTMSADYVLQCGVPQGSVLCPILYCKYTRPVCDIVARHGMQYHCYADDIQIYATVGRDQCIAAALLKIEACVVEVADWMVRNQLKSNKDKSQAITFHTVKQSPHVPVDTYVNIAGQRVRLATYVRNLGVLFDRALTMGSQVASVAKTCYYQIRNIGQIRSCITSDACKILVHAPVTSRLDYCNALLYGLPETLLKRLQRVQNCAARLICRRKKHDHVTPLLKELHWLPIHVRPTYKLLTIAYSVMHGLAPEYLAQILDRHRPRRVLRSASAELFFVPL